MDNNTLWTLTAHNVVKFCIVSLSRSSKDTKQDQVRQMKVRHATRGSDKNSVKVVVTS